MSSKEGMLSIVIHFRTKKTGNRNRSFLSCISKNYCDLMKKGDPILLQSKKNTAGTFSRIGNKICNGKIKNTSTHFGVVS